MYKLYICGTKHQLIDQHEDLGEILKTLSFAFYDYENEMYLITERVNGGDSAVALIRNEQDYFDIIDKYNNKTL